MAAELLVDDHIEDGARLVTELVRNGFDVAAAFWVRTQEDGLWFLYLATSSVARDGYAKAFGRVYSTLSRLGIQAIAPSQIKLIESVDPLAVAVVAVRDRYPARIPTRLGPGRLDGVAIEEAYIYPPADRALTRNEVIQAVTALMNRTGMVQPSSVTLRDGSTLLAIPVGIQVTQPGGQVTVTLHEHPSGRDRVVPADDITTIQ